MSKHHLSTAFRGLLFGMTLQLAIGPVCLFIFTTASANGFLNAAAGVMGVVIIDALYIALAFFGVSRLLKSNNLKKNIGLAGAVIVALFGVKLIIDGFHPVPVQHGGTNFSTTAPGAFLTALVLTASNPLTILFWTGIFGIRLNSQKDNGESSVAFSSGCLGATLLFLTAVALLGGIIREIVPIRFISVLNVSAGVLFIIYSIKRVTGLLGSPAGAAHG